MSQTTEMPREMQILESTGTLRRDRLQFTQGKETVLVISPQQWGGFHISKHHYASLLAELGNRVYFLDPPTESGRRGSVQIHSTGINNLFRLGHRTLIPYRFKFRVRRLFDWGMKQQAKRILRVLDPKPTVIWDFDNTNLFRDLRWFPETYRIFHPVDQLETRYVGAKHSDRQFAVAQVIADRLKAKGCECIVIPHGLGKHHHRYAIRRLDSLNGSASPQPTNKLRIGYVGNLAAESVDRDCILTIVEQNPLVQFEIFGPTNGRESDSSFQSWLQRIAQFPHVQLHGLTGPEEILSEADSIDGWLVSYDSGKDINGGANSHKILEYLATGKMVVSSRLDAYVGQSVIRMPNCKSNQELPAIFRDCILNVAELNRVDLQRQRIRFALEHSYLNHIEKIQNICNAEGFH